MEEDTATQHKKQYDWLKQYQWQKGQSGNPEGGKKGKRLKTFVAEMLERMSDEDKAEYLKRIDPDLVWRMAEGNPKQDTDITTDGKPIYLPAEIIEKHHLNDSTSSPETDSTGQTQV